MNKPLSPKDVTSKVTTEPLSGSRKVYSSPEGHADLSVPLREIALAESEKPFRVYDTSGPYTDPDVRIDVERGLPPLRKPWIEARARRSRDAARAGAGRHRHPGNGLSSPIARISDAQRRRPRRPRRGSQTGRASALRCPHSSRRNSCAAKSRAAAPSSPPISITRNPSR